MNRLAALVWRLINPPEWREIATAPFDRELELAVIEEEIGILNGAWLRHGDGWFDAASLQPISISATHWRYRPADIIAMCCC